MDQNSHVEEVRLDLARSERKGFGEVVYCSGKSDGQLLAIAREIHAKEINIAFSRMNLHQHGIVASIAGTALRYDSRSSLGWTEYRPIAKMEGVIAVVTAGSTDVQAAEEAAGIAGFCGYEVKRFYDVGVAGLHRFMSVLPELSCADVIIVAAGMDGALPSVVAGLVPVLVIGLPTSVGYGIAAGGETALRTMLCSCSPGLVAVNIDNGIGAGLAAVMAARRKCAD